MNCYKVQRSLSAYCERSLATEQQRQIGLHLSVCQTCASLSEQVTQLRAALRTMPKLSPPSHLRTSLRVLASREQALQPYRSSARAILAHYRSHVRLWADNMMRPLALPLAGGLVSAVLLFTVLVPAFAPPRVTAADDVPIPISTEASIASTGPFGFSEGDIFVVVTINAQGRIIDYSTPSGQAWVKDPQVRRNVENFLLSIIFNPSTTFGQPASGKVRVTFRRSEIDVKG
jgi:hypothetical protein